MKAKDLAGITDQAEWLLRRSHNFMWYRVQPRIRRQPSLPYLLKAAPLTRQEDTGSPRRATGRTLEIFKQVDQNAVRVFKRVEELLRASPKLEFQPGAKEQRIGTMQVSGKEGTLYCRIRKDHRAELDLRFGADQALRLGFDANPKSREVGGGNRIPTVTYETESRRSLGSSVFTLHYDYEPWPYAVRAIQVKQADGERRVATILATKY